MNRILVDDGLVINTLPYKTIKELEIPIYFYIKKGLMSYT
jgi:hypothetical protein